MQDAKSQNQFADFWAVGVERFHTKNAQTLIFLASEYDPSSQRRSNMIFPDDFITHIVEPMFRFIRANSDIRPT